MVQLKTGKLDSLCEERQQVCEHLEAAIAARAQSQRRRVQGRHGSAAKEEQAVRATSSATVFEPDDEPQHYLSWCCCAGDDAGLSAHSTAFCGLVRTVPAVAFYQRRLDDLNAQVESMKGLQVS